MTIFFPPEMPPPSSYALGLIANTQSGGRSPFTGSEQTLVLPGARWGADLAWQGLEDGEWRAMQAFLAELGGRAGRFTWGPPAQPRRGVAPAPDGVSVRGGGQVGRAIVTRGWQPGMLCWRKGDLLGWSDPAGRPQMHVVTADAGSDGNGHCGCWIAPPIRRSPNDGAGVTSLPQPVWKLTEDFNPLTFAGHTVLSDLTIKIEEALFG